jgi:hypothetical protein
MICPSTAVLTTPSCKEPMKLTTVAAKKKSSVSTFAQSSRFSSMGLIRLHWDFFGPDAVTTAEHFLHHLDEFCKRENVIGYRHWVWQQPVRSTAIMECDEQYLKPVRDALRPVRGERVIEK